MTNYYKLPLEFDHLIYIHTYFREFNGPDGDVCLSHDAIVERVHQVEPRLNEINDWNQAEEKKREREREQVRTVCIKRRYIVQYNVSRSFQSCLPRKLDHQADRFSTGGVPPSRNGGWRFWLATDHTDI